MRVIDRGVLSDWLNQRERQVPYQEVYDSVRQIVDDVRLRQDAAVMDCMRRYDGVMIDNSDIEVSRAEMCSAQNVLPADVVSSIDYAATAVYKFHLMGVPSDEIRYIDGLRVTRRADPIKTAGVYAPRGSRGYPSSVIMAACAARAAGVGEVVLCTPPGKQGNISAEVMHAAFVSGVDRMFRIGGAAAIAAMAYGTQTVPKVDKIVGPGNEYVSQAKRLVYGAVGIDMIAGPSEVLVIADECACAEWVAYDLAAQAEHGSNSWALLVTDSVDLLQRVQNALCEDDPNLGEVVAVVVDSLEEAAELASSLAPEHLELFVRQPDVVVPRIRNCGAVFVGPYACAPLADYALGPNHVLPTGGSARFSSGLSAADFVRYTNIVELSECAARDATHASAVLAEIEGYTRHARAIRMRRGGEAE